MAVEEIAESGLDESTAALLQSIADQNGPALHEMPPEVCREVFNGLVTSLQGEIHPIHASKDIEIPGPNGPIPARVYTPRDTGGEKLPMLVLFHGGGWVIGNVETHDNQSRYFANNADVIVVNVDYRLAPEHKFPEGHDDAIAATEWVIENADSLGGNASKVAVTGDSAGGNMAAVVAQALKSKIAFQLLVYPVTDMSSDHYPSRAKFGGGDFFLGKADMEYFGGHTFKDAKDASDPKMSPMLTEDVSGLAPALTVTAGHDMLCDEGKVYADRLRDAGVPSEYKCYEGTIHGFTLLPGALQAGVDGLAFMAERLKSALS
jgi:acetyl esterase